MKKIIKIVKGFTIAEMLIVTVIMGFLMVVATQTYMRQRDRFIFNSTLIKVMEIMKTTRNFATTSNPIFHNNNYIVAPEGYGIYINLDAGEDEPHFTIYGNIGTRPDHRYNTDPADPNMNLYDADDEILETYRLPYQVNAFSLFFDGVEAYNYDDEERITSEADIIFRPPLAETSLTDHGFGSYEEIRLKLENPEASDGSKGEWVCIMINRIKTFPQLEYHDCSI